MDDTLERALRVLFGSPAQGRSFLEIPGDGGEREAPASHEGRVERLEHTLLGYVVEQAAELEELGDDERERLTSEARATLIAVREIRRWLK